MREVNFWFFLKSYIKDHKKIIIYSILALLIFSGIIMLHNLPLNAVGYGAVLCLVLAIIFFIYDFYFYMRQNKILLKKFLSIAETMEGLPEPRYLTEENWLNLLIVSYDSAEKNRGKMNTVMSDMIDYYTMWAHQIKTPISAMKLLLQSNDDKVSSNIKRELDNELFKIEQYVEMVLSYMRLESETTDYVIKEYDLDSIIKQSIKRFSIPFINKKISLEFEESGLKAITDEKWLGFAVDQVLSNAIKYTDEGSVSIKTSVDESNSEVINIIIKDTGIGIASEDLPRIFEKGYTGYNGRVEKKSTGIGLFLTRKILSKLRHSINVESEVDNGTTVVISLVNRE